MARGKKTGGRKRGSKNRRTRALDAAAAQGQVPLDFMLQVMRDPTKNLELRCEMAKAAAPYLHARRAPEDKQGGAIPTIIYTHPDLEEPE